MIPKLIKIDPDNPPVFKRQLLFYNDQFNLFRLGEVDYIREDESGRTVVYKSFQDIKIRQITSSDIFTVTFIPTHYVNLDLTELSNNINN